MCAILSIIFTVAGLMSKNLEICKVGGLFAIATSINLLSNKISGK